MSPRPTGAARAPRPAYRCAECGAQATRWVGRCPECQAWGTLAEAAAPSARAVAAGPVGTAALPIAEVDALAARARPTGVGELDRVLGGGLVPGGVVLLAGEPGVGKSTLLLSVAHHAARAGAPALIVTGEESAGQVRARAGRMGALSPHLYLAAETELAALLGHVEQVAPALLVVDSVQTLHHPNADGAPGGPTQIREVAAAVIKVAKERGMATLLVGHVTKDGGIAGPKLLEHLVDVVLSFEGERHSTLRLVRAVKNRFGAIDEVGCFVLDDDGITGLPDPSTLFLSGAGADRAAPPGTCVTVTVEGRRPLVVELQALVVGTEAHYPRRAVTGLDGNRVSMLLAVLEKHAGLPLGRAEVYAATVGGARVGEPAADLALTLALAGAQNGRRLPPGSVAFGEVGLAGEVRGVPGLPRRLAEAARLGFHTAYVPAASPAAAGPAGLAVVRVADVTEALSASGLGPRPRT